MIRLKPWQELVLIALLALAILALGYGPERSNSLWLLSFSSLAFLAYMFICNAHTRWKRVFIAALLIRVGLLAAPVGWTDDHFRYIFDGGISFFDRHDVYNISPESAAVQHDQLGNEFVALVNHTETYTVYPPFAQLVFANSYALGSGDSLHASGRSDIDAVIGWMRVFILIMETLTIAGLIKMLSILALPRSWIAWYALNPLVLMEFSVNLHTEVYMITWCVLALLALKQGNWLVSAVLMGLAASAKLWPLMFLAFLPAWLGWRKGMQYGILMLITFVLSWLPFVTESLIDNVMASLKLYFSFFEFNASFYYLLKEILPDTWVKGSPLMGLLTVVFVSSLGLVAWFKRWRSPAECLLWALAIYFSLASTVHPWYILPILAFASLGRYRWPFIWSALIIPTYLTYGSDPYQQPFWWLWLEYALLFGIIALELMVHSSWAMRKRAAIKFNRLGNMIPEGARVLDIGTGNGALANALLEAGINITTVDVVDNCRFEQVKPQIITGGALPFADQSFDVVLIITVLHHTKDQSEILTEAKRVGKELIVMEDVYNTRFQRFMTYLFDSLINLEFWGHPHSNRSDREWRQLFESKELDLSRAQHLRTLGYFDQIIYRLRVLNSSSP